MRYSVGVLPSSCVSIFKLFSVRFRHGGLAPSKIGVWVKSVRRIGRGAFAQCHSFKYRRHIVQELCENRGGRPGLSVLTNLLVSVDVKLY